VKEVNELNFCDPGFTVKMAGGSLHRCLKRLKRYRASVIKMLS